MNWQMWLNQYGYAAVVVGTFLEGETILVMAGFAAHEGYLLLPWVMLAAFSGSFCGDQLFFFVGRLQGRKLLAKHPKWSARVARVHQLMARWHDPFILAFRFLYGLRTISPFVLGTSDVHTRRFFILNMIGAALWAVCVAALGYVFGEVVELAIGRAKQYEVYALAALGAIVAIVTLVLYLRNRRRNAAADGTG